MLKKALQQTLEQSLQVHILEDRSISGGCIHDARQLRTTKGSFFLKQNEGELGLALLQAEREGLQTLATVAKAHVPEIVCFGQAENTAYLVLSFIESGQRSPAFWQQFGEALADLHQYTDKQFGFPSDNFIGALPQANDRRNDWASFYKEVRLLPQLQMALQHNQLTHKDEIAFDRLFDRFDQYFPEEPPTLTHGDLWSGNFLCNEAAKAVFIDPAVSYAHREMDLAMSRLFGGFTASFYESYEAHFPLAPNFESRLPLYQLYYLLVHVNLFGGSYVGSVRGVLKQYV